MCIEELEIYVELAARKNSKTSVEAGVILSKPPRGASFDVVNAICRSYYTCPAPREKLSLIGVYEEMWYCEYLRCNDIFLYC